MNRLARLLADGADALSRVGRWVARFTFWQFVAFSLLVLVAGAMVESAISPDRPPAVVLPKKAAGGTAVAPMASAPVARAASAVDSPGASAAADGRPAGELVAKQVQIGPDGIVIRGAGRSQDELRIGWKGLAINDATTQTEHVGRADADEPEAAAPANGGRRGRLMQLLLAALAILWVMRFVVRARVKADARVGQAQAVAEREALERKLVEARLQALQAQVEPHFLFNTLAAVEHLIETDPPRAGEMQRHLIAFLRGAMPQMRGQASCLGDEVELCRAYLAIMKIRMDERLSYTIDLPAELASARFPVLMLQSVVENAIKHGLEPKAEGGTVLISARVAAGRLRVIVADSGLGFGHAGTAGTGVGLNNIRERLRALFGDRAALVVSANAPTGAQVTIEVPIESTDSHHRG